MPTRIIIAVLSIRRVLSNAIISGRTIRQAIMHAHSSPITEAVEQRWGERREGEFKACLTAQAMGAGDERKRDYFKGEWKCF